MTVPPRVLLKALGCRVNEAELEEWARDFRRLGFDVCGDRSNAGPPVDLVVINTCAVTAEAARKSRQLLRRARLTNPEARLVVTGCLAALEPEDLAREAGLDLLVTNRDKDRLVEIASETLSLPVMPELATRDAAGALFARGRQRAFVKVQDGCRHACTFCVTTRARGAERSRPPDQILTLVNRLADSGVREVVLCGVHLGGYGSDLGIDLGHLIRTLLERTTMPRIRLGSLEPWDLPRGFWELFSDPRLMPHLHLPMQSGSDAVLQRMARRCKSAQFARLVEQGRTAVPRLNITTDIIVGFPGETDSEWSETLSFVEAMDFGQIHAFAYSPRTGTRATTLPGQVAAVTTRRRGRELQTIERRLRRRVLEAQTGARAAVLREAGTQSTGPEELFGYTPNYLPVLVDPCPDPPAVGEVMEVSLVGTCADGEHLRGRLARAEARPLNAESPLRLVPNEGKPQLNEGCSRRRGTAPPR